MEKCGSNQCVLRQYYLLTTSTHYLKILNFCCKIVLYNVSYRCNSIISRKISLHKKIKSMVLYTILILKYRYLRKHCYSFLFAKKPFSNIFWHLVGLLLISFCKLIESILSWRIHPKVRLGFPLRIIHAS